MNCKALKRVGQPCGACGWQNLGDVITLEAYFMGRDVSHHSELSDTIKGNADRLLGIVNSLIHEIASINPSFTWRVSSGWRPASINASLGGAPNSKHVLGRAVDLLDPERWLQHYLVANQDCLARRGLAMEHPDYCSKRQQDGSIAYWVHLQDCLPPSGKVVFQPYPGPPKQS